MPGLAFIGPDLGKGGPYIATINLPETNTPAPDGSVRYTLYPALLDLLDHTVQPIVHPFGDAGYDPSRNRVAAVMPGPFDKVTGTGSCLNIRSAPSQDASSVACVADGVMLFDDLTGDKLVSATPIDGWREVLMPDGTHGYASTDFLEYIH